MADDSPRARFYRLVSEAVADIETHGFDSEERLNRWVERLEAAAVVAAVPVREMTARLQEQLDRAFRGALAPRRVLRVHPGVGTWTLERIRPELRRELDRRIAASASLIRLDREASIQRTLQRFSGWATSVPAGGTRAVSRSEEAEAVRRGIAGLPFIERRVVIDQGHKLVAAIDDIIAKDGGAIAVMWRHVRPQPGYEPRPEHVARDGKVYAMRGSWALASGLMKRGPHPYFDEIEQPGMPVFCRCWGQRIYTPRALPADMLTEKGRRWLLEGEERKRA